MGAERKNGAEEKKSQDAPAVLIGEGGFGQVILLRGDEQRGVEEIVIKAMPLLPSHIAPFAEKVSLWGRSVDSWIVEFYERANPAVTSRVNFLDYSEKISEVIKIRQKVALKVNEAAASEWIRSHQYLPGSEHFAKYRGASFCNGGRFGKNKEGELEYSLNGGQYHDMIRTTSEFMGFLYMDLAIGQNLREIFICGEEEPLSGLSLKSFFRFTYQAAEAVGFLHKIGIAHRDLTLGNFHVDEEGNAQIVDLGACRYFAEGLEGVFPHISDFSMLINSTIYTEKEDLTTITPGYSAPEQFDTTPKTTIDYLPAIDAYQLALVLGSVASGKRPYMGELERDSFAHYISDMMAGGKNNRELLLDNLHQSEAYAELGYEYLTILRNLTSKDFSVRAAGVEQAGIYARQKLSYMEERP